MDASFDVKFWSIENRAGKRGTTYRVPWFVDKTRFGETFGTFAHADSFRSDLVAAARRGEAFDRVGVQHEAKGDEQTTQDRAGLEADRGAYPARFPAGRRPRCCARRSTRCR